MEKPEIKKTVESAASILRRHRSPNYPFIGLEKAIERAKQIYDVERRHEVPIKVASEKRWEYKPGSSQGDQTIAALRAFGLVDVGGSGEKRMIRISDRAYRILAGAQDAADRIKDAALAPSIHGELWQKYGTNGLPSDDTIRNYLLFERESGRFNEDVVDNFIARFKETISFAKLDSSDKIDEVEGRGNDGKSPNEGEEGHDVDNLAVQDQRKSNTPPPPTGSKQAVFPGETGDVVVRWPAVLTAAEYSDIEGWLDMLKRNIKRSVKGDGKPTN
jgi:hypothetical protein